MEPGAVSWNCPTWAVNGNVESFSLLTKYLSYYLSIPTAHGDHTGGWAAQVARAKINSLSARPADALVLIYHQQQMMFGTQTLPQPPLLYPRVQRPFRKTISQQIHVTALSLHMPPFNLHSHPARRLRHHSTLHVWQSHLTVEKTEAQGGYQGRARAGNQVSKLNPELFSLCHGDRTLSILQYTMPQPSHQTQATSQPETHWGWGSGPGLERGKEVGGGHIKASGVPLSSEWEETSWPCLGNLHGVHESFIGIKVKLHLERTHSMGKGA